MTRRAIRRGGLRVSVGAAVLALAASSMAAAQTAPAPPAPRVPTQAAPAQPSREELNPASRIPVAPAVERDIFSPEPAGPCPLRDSDVQVTLKSVSLRGLTAVSPTAMSAAFADLVGKPTTVASICDIRDRAARVLFDRGVLARVEIPEQRISDGALVLEVIEAKVVNVRVRGDVGPGQAAVERYVEHLRGMAPFDMRLAQRYLLLASDVAGMRVRAAVRPSTTTGERGAVDIDVTLTRKPVDVLVNVQNLESRAIGRFGGLARVDFNSFTPFGEHSAVTFYHTLDSDEQWVIQGQEEARFGADGLIGRLSLVYGETRPGDVLKPLGLESRSFVGEAELAYPWLRTRRRNLNIAAGFDVIDQTTDIGGAGRLNQDDLRILYARADGDLRTEAFSRTVQFGAALQLRKGIEGLGSSRAGSLLLTRAGGRPDAFVVRASGSVQTNLVERLVASLQVQAQYADSPLLAYEQLAVGNLTIGRGYDPAVSSGDSGVTTALELRYGPVPIRPGLLVTPYVFYDLGYLSDRGQGGSDRTLTSAGVGLQFRLADRVNLDIAYATPFDGPAPGAPRPTPRLLINLTASLY